MAIRKILRPIPFPPPRHALNTAAGSRYREEHPGTPAATQATRSAIHLLQLANQDRGVIAKAEMLPPNEPAWDSVIGDFRASARKSGQYERFIPYTRSLLEKIRDNRTRANVHLHLGRAYLDRDESSEAKAAFEAILKEAPGSSVIQRLPSRPERSTEHSSGRLTLRARSYS